MNCMNCELSSGVFMLETTGRLPQGDVIFALDIGTRTVVGLLGVQEEDAFVLSHCVQCPHPKKSMNDGQIEDIKQVAKVVMTVKEQLEKESGILLKRVCIAAAGRALKTKQFSVDFDVSDRDVITRDMVKSFELETVQKAQAQLDEEYSNGGIERLFFCVGHSMLHSYLDGDVIMNLEGHRGGRASVELIATFLPNVVVDGLYAVVEQCGLTVDSMTLEPIAAMSVIIPPEIRLINIALVDIGAGTSDIAISKDGSIVAYAMATIAGDEITEEIIKEFFVDFNMAESMKHQSTSGAAEIAYRDIFGMDQSVKTCDFSQKIDKAVDILADTICEHIREINGGVSTTAVFLVGGGSLITGLTDKVADNLSIRKDRVAIGGQRVFRHVRTGQFDVGAEFATPLGIAVTGFQNKGYDFSVITLNNEPVRVFDTRNVTVFDLLTMQGYKNADIMGRSGRALTYTLNGRRQLVKGGDLIPAEVVINGEPASLRSRVTRGDSVVFKPANTGTDARLFLGDLPPEMRPGFALYNGLKYAVGSPILVNGVEKGLDYEVNQTDDIATGYTPTLQEFLRNADADLTETYMVNGEVVDYDTQLQDGDIIAVYTTGLADALFPGKKDGDSDMFPLNPVQSAAGENPDIKTEWGEITLTFNGEQLTLPPNTDRDAHMFVELMSYAKLGPQTSGYQLVLNGREAQFLSELHSGDVAALILEDALPLAEIAEASEEREHADAESESESESESDDDFYYEEPESETALENLVKYLETE